MVRGGKFQKKKTSIQLFQSNQTKSHNHALMCVKHERRSVHIHICTYVDNMQAENDSNIFTSMHL